MVMTYYLTVTLGLWFILGVDAYTNYHGYQVIQCTPVRDDQLAVLLGLQGQVDFWVPPSSLHSPVHVMVGPHHQTLLDCLSEAGLEWEVYVDNVGALVDLSVDERDEEISPTRDLNTSRFYSKDELYGFLDTEITECGDDCQLISMGTSYENNDLQAVKISRPGTDRRAIWLDAAVHAREWLTPMVAAYVIERLVRDYGVDPEVTLVRDAFDWYIAPLVNPDGYEYTWTTDRLWRKTRKPNDGVGCLGTDGNRNYDYVWDLGSTNQCGETYRGDSPESEPEISQLTAQIEAVSVTLDLHINLHTYGQIVLRPWGYTAEEPEDATDLIRLGQIGVDAINANSNVTYVLGKTSGAGSGMGMDWAKAVAGIKYAYIIEMRDNGNYGFVAPPSEILPTCREVFAGIVAMATDLASTGGFESKI